MSKNPILALTVLATSAFGAQSGKEPYREIAMTAAQVQATAQQIREQAVAAKPDEAALRTLAATQVAQTSRLVREFQVMQLGESGTERDWVLREKADALADLAVLQTSILSGPPDWRWLRKSAKQQAGLAADLSRTAGTL